MFSDKLNQISQGAAVDVGVAWVHAVFLDESNQMGICMQHFWAFFNESNEMGIAAAACSVFEWVKPNEYGCCNQDFETNQSKQVYSDGMDAIVGRGRAAEIPVNAVFWSSDKGAPNAWHLPRMIALMKGFQNHHRACEMVPK